MATAGIIVIGNEILSGKVEEANARFLIDELRSLGVGLERIAIIRDEVDTIAQEVRAMSAAVDHVFTSGGVGSTHDDVTFEGVARGLDESLRVHPDLEKLLEEHFADRMNEHVRRMCTVPESTELLWGDQGRYPVVKAKNVYVLPGVPQFLRAKFDILRPRLQGEPFFLRQLFASAREDQVAEILGTIQSDFEDLELGSYPRFDTAEYRVRLTIEGKDAARVEQALQVLTEALDPSWIVRVE